jgi:hypothetical protein
MNDLERRHQARLASEREAKERREQAQEESEAPEWRPRDNSAYERVQIVVDPERMRAEPLRYG